MKSLAKSPLYLPSPPTLSDGQEAIEEYLECLISPLVGAVPYRERATLRAETAFHLERLQDDYERKGMSPYDAALQAISDYGSSRKMAEDFLQSWFRKSSTGPLSLRFGHGNVIAFTAFGLAQVLCTIVLQLRVYLPSNSALNFAIRPDRFNEIFPPSLPVPELTPLYGLTLAAAFGGPLVAGAIVGYFVPVHAGRVTYQALLPCIIFSFFSGVLLLPAKELLLFGLLQTVYWVPAGSAVAALVSLYARQRRCRFGEGR